MAVTVLMPAYNAAGTIVAAAESVLAEPLTDLVLLVIDDGSTDGTAETVTALDDPRIRVVRQANTGLVGALNRGLAEADTEFLARMDADDLSVPGRIAAQLDWLRAHPGAIACGTDYELLGEMTGRVRVPRTDRACRQRARLASPHCGASMVWRRAPAQAAGLRFDPDFAHAEDYDYFARLAGLGTVANLPMVGYRYLIHRGQVSDRFEAPQQAAHLRIAHRTAQQQGRTPLPDPVLVDLLWSRDDAARRPGPVAAAAARAVVRYRGLETVRFTGRKLIEAFAAARR